MLNAAIGELETEFQITNWLHLKRHIWNRVSWMVDDVLGNLMEFGWRFFTLGRVGQFHFSIRQRKLKFHLLFCWVEDRVTSLLFVHWFLCFHFEREFSWGWVVIMEERNVDTRSTAPTHDEQGSVKQPTSHPFLPPRVDENFYQTRVPELRTLPKGQCSLVVNWIARVLISSPMDFSVFPFFLSFQSTKSPWPKRI